MTFRTSWGISFHEYLVPLFSVRVSLRTRRTSSVDPERPSSCRPRPHPREFHPYPVETQVDPGRIRVGDPERPSSGRPRPHPRKVQPYPVETQVDPGRIRVVDPERTSSRRPRLASIQSNRPALIRSKPVDPERPSSRRPRPDRIRINRPGRIRGNSSKLRHIQANSGQTQANPADKGKHKQLQHIPANKGKKRQRKAT